MKVCKRCRPAATRVFWLILTRDRKRTTGLFSRKPVFQAVAVREHSPCESWTGSTGQVALTAGFSYQLVRRYARCMGAYPRRNMTGTDERTVGVITRKVHVASRG